MDFVTAAEEPLPSHASSTLIATVAVVEMVGYSTIAKILEENLGPESVADLNQQIRAFISHALQEIPDTQTYRMIASTGDGAIVLFEHAEDAHRYGFRVHRLAHEHTDKRSETTAERWFRVGIATGEVNVVSATDLRSEYAGIAIANAVRLEASAKPGEIVADAETFARFGSETQALYGSKEIVHGKREERFSVHKCRVTQPASKPKTYRTHSFTRRQAINLSAGAFAVAAGTAWYEWPSTHRIRKPLPAKRFVALMAWPAANPESAALIESVLASIHTRVRRAEHSIHDFVILSARDMSEGGGAIDPDRANLKPGELAALWGATLVLAASIEKSWSTSHLQLRLLDAGSLDPLRSDSFPIEPSHIESANEAASRSAVQLLELPPQDRRLTDDDELSGFPAAAQHLLFQGREAGSRPNDSGLAEAIENYQEAVAKYSNFALAYAELGKAYLRQFLNTFDTEFIDLAEKNLKAALSLNDSSVRAHLGQSELLAEKGQFKEASQHVATALIADPTNAEAQFLKARILEKAGDFPLAEIAYRKVIDLRPNYWRGYNNLGAVQQPQAKYKDAVENINRSST